MEVLEKIIDQRKNFNQEHANVLYAIDGKDLILFFTLIEEKLLE